RAGWQPGADGPRLAKTAPAQPRFAPRRDAEGALHAAGIVLPAQRPAAPAVASAATPPAPSAGPPAPPATPPPRAPGARAADSLRHARADEGGRPAVSGPGRHAARRPARARRVRAHRRAHR